MRKLLGPVITSTILSTAYAKYLPINVRQAAGTTKPAVLVLEQNPGCCLLSSALSVCTSLTPGFTTMAPSLQAPCLCYSSTAWQPAVFDNAVKTCADFASTVYPVAYTPIHNLENFCSDVGEASNPSSTSPNSTSVEFNAACDLVDSLVQSCVAISPGFQTMSATNQASCLCYASTSSWMPTIFDNAVNTCADFAKTADTKILPVVQSLSGFCHGVGNIVSTRGAVTTTTVAPVTTFSSITASAAGTAGSPLSAPSTAATGTSSTLDLTISINVGASGWATSTATVSKNGAGLERVSDGEAILISLACAAVIIFLC